MLTMSTRTLMDLAYERGEEFDPAISTPAPAVVEELGAWAHAALPVEAPSRYEARRRSDRERRAQLAYVPDWFSVQDLVERPAGTLGELI